MAKNKPLVKKHEPGGVFKGWRCRKRISKIGFEKVFNVPAEQEAERQAREWLLDVAAVVQAWESRKSQYERIKIASGGKIEIEIPRKPKGGTGEEDIQWLLSLTDATREIVKEEVKTLKDVWEICKDKRMKKPKKMASTTSFIYHSKSFCKFLPDIELPSKLDDGKWLEVLEEIRSGIDASKYKNNTKNSMISTLRGFITFLKKRKYIAELPATLDEIGEKKKIFPKPRKVDEVDLGKIWEASTNLYKSYIIMSLNFGFYMADISQLTAGNLDLVKGRVFGVREKTKEKSNVVYNFPMWEETKFWIKWRIDYQETINAKNETPYLFCTRNGKALNQWKSKSFSNMVVRVFEKNIYTYSQLRDTAATELHKKNPAITDIFLRHAAANKMRKFYVEEGDISPSVDAAIMELRKSFPFLDMNMTGDADEA